MPREYHFSITEGNNITLHVEPANNFVEALIQVFRRFDTLKIVLLCSYEVDRTCIY
jgi:hypothetical protein